MKRLLLWHLLLIALLFVPNLTAADSAVRIAVLNELSGRQAGFGAECAEGLELARHTALKNSDIEIVIGDSQGKPAAAISELRKLVEVQGAVVAIAVGTHVCMPLKPLAAQLQVPLLCLSSHSELLNDNPYMFRFWTSTPVEGQALAEVFARVPGKKIAFLTVDDEYPLSLAEHARSYFEKLGGEVVRTEIVLPGESDYATMVTRIVNSGVTGVFVNAGTTEVGPILRKFREQSRKLQIFSNVRLRAKGVAEAAGAEVVEGVVFVDLDVEKPFFTKRLRQVAPKAVPASINYTCYAALTAAIQAIATAKTPVTRETVHKALGKLSTVELLDDHLEIKNREAQFVPRLKVYRKGKVWSLPKTS